LTQRNSPEAAQAASLSGDIKMEMVDFLIACTLNVIDKLETESDSFGICCDPITGTEWADNLIHLLDTATA